MGKWTPEQQAEHRRAWVKALRSGKYKQAVGSLQNDEGFCCLGVACDVYLKSGDAPKTAKWDNFDFQFKAPRKPKETADGVFLVSDHTCDSDLPPTVQDWLGLSSVDGTYYEKTDCLWPDIEEDGKRYNSTSLISKNDDDNLDFKKIASIIVKEPKGLIKHGK